MTSLSVAVDGVPVCYLVAHLQCSWTPAIADIGEHVVAAGVTDTAGRTAVATATIRVARLAPAQVRARVIRKRLGRGGWRLRTRGAIAVPAGLTAAACGGTATVTVLRGSRTLVDRSVRVGKGCGFSSKVSLRAPKGVQAGVKVVFEGAALLAPRSAPVQTVRLREPSPTLAPWRGPWPRFRDSCSSPPRRCRTRTSPARSWRSPTTTRRARSGSCSTGPATPRSSRRSPSSRASSTPTRSSSSAARSSRRRSSCSPSSRIPARRPSSSSDGIGLVSDRTGLERLGDATARRRVFAGYAGWGPGQLEAELEREDWILEPRPARGRLRRGARGALGAACSTRKGGQFRLLARMPVDPSVN